MSSLGVLFSDCLPRRTVSASKHDSGQAVVRDREPLLPASGRPPGRRNSALPPAPGKKAAAGFSHLPDPLPQTESSADSSLHFSSPPPFSPSSLRERRLLKEKNGKAMSLRKGLAGPRQGVPREASHAPSSPTLSLPSPPSPADSSELMEPLSFLWEGQGATCDCPGRKGA